mmetsp:Transcript_27024/g.46087  ORF Transcript_27024/g.46087 Transcript_27024/m.46087 type:complete len:369 (-) Transcript_27024:82-1188(-)
MSRSQDERGDVARQPQTDSGEVVEATSPNIVASNEVHSSILVAYRSVGLGTFGAFMRFAGMPLEKIALFMNSSQVTGKNQFAQSIKLTFREGALAPFRVVGPASMVAWFMQYSVMGLAFQFFDHALSRSLGVTPVWYGDELMEPPPKEKQSLDGTANATNNAKAVAKTVLAPILAGSLESVVANRAEVQRYFGPSKFAAIEGKLGWNPVSRLFAPAFASNAMRNVIMCNTSFIITPITYRLYFPQEKKSNGSLFWYGMGMNFAGNAVAITQQALWGRALDYAAENGGRNIKYSEVIRSSLKKEGMAAFITMPKWFSRILMNAPVQGSLPWFYNNVLPLGEPKVVDLAKWATSSSDDYGTEGNHTGSIS